LIRNQRHAQGTVASHRSFQFAEFGRRRGRGFSDDAMMVRTRVRRVLKEDLLEKTCSIQNWLIGGKRFKSKHSKLKVRTFRNLKKGGAEGEAWRSARTTQNTEKRTRFKSSQETTRRKERGGSGVVAGGEEMARFAEGRERLRRTAGYTLESDKIDWGKTPKISRTVSRVGGRREKTAESFSGGTQLMNENESIT